jgi:hypothetical protein
MLAFIFGGVLNSEAGEDFVGGRVLTSVITCRDETSTTRRRGWWRHAGRSHGAARVYRGINGSNGETGGLRYIPTITRTFSMNNGSGPCHVQGR